tara:strand:+ start:576 stop:731 length:156 start_codon:yes stop_codon:yes gene_type:complete
MLIAPIINPKKYEPPSPANTTPPNKFIKNKIIIGIRIAINIDEIPLGLLRE